jgi:hypothetical protein
MTLKTLEYLTPNEQEFVRRTGELPSRIQFHHLLTIADFPEFGHLPEVGVGLPEDVHKGAGHGGDTTRPVEAGTLLDPDYETRPPFQEDPAARKGARTKQADIAEGRAASTEKQGGINRDLLVERNVKLKASKRALEQLEKRAARSPSEQLKKRIAQLKKQVGQLEWEITQIESLIEGQTAAAGAAPLPEAATTSSPVDESTPLSQPAAVAPVETGAPPASGTGAQVEPVAPPPLPESSAAPAPDQPPAVMPASSPTGAAPGSFSASKLLTTLSQLPPAAHAGAHAGEKKGEGGGGLLRNVSDFYQMGARPMTTTETAVYYRGGPIAGGAAVTATRGFEQARREPIVERVNPSYPAPPLTPQDQVDVQNQILLTLDARAKTEDVARVMARQKTHHEDNEQPLTDMQEGTEEAISATEAHKQAVERRTEANTKKKEHEEQASGAFKDYSDRAAKLVAVTGPMRAFERFTSLATSLPDSPDVLQNAKREILKMSRDSRDFLDKLDQMDATINEQKDGQPDREKQIASDADTLGKTDEMAGQSDQQLGEAKQTAQDIDGQNKDRLTEATDMHRDANRAGAKLDAQAQQQQAQAQSQAAALQDWAQKHRKARLDALKATQQRMEKMGFRITDVREK